VLENGIPLPLPLPYPKYEDIRVFGEGRYSFGKDDLIFSSSDDSNPKSNGKQYAIGKESVDSLRIHIDFGTPAVRL
jgi:hypothetical protein